MKRLKTSDVTANAELPIKVGTLEFLQDAYKEQLDNTFKAIVPYPIVGQVYIIYGCINSGSGLNYIISSGALYYNGEIYNFDGATFTLAAGQFAYARINTTQFTTNADPVTFTDGISRNVHNINKIVIEATSTSSGLPTYDNFKVPTRTPMNIGGIINFQSSTGGAYAVSGDIASAVASATTTPTTVVTLANPMRNLNYKVTTLVQCKSSLSLASNFAAQAPVYRIISTTQFEFAMGGAKALASDSSFQSSTFNINFEVTHL